MLLGGASSAGVIMPLFEKHERIIHFVGIGTLSPDDRQLTGAQLEGIKRVQRGMS